MQVAAESHESAPKEAETQLEARHLTVIPMKGVDYKRSSRTCWAKRLLLTKDQNGSNYVLKEHFIYKVSYSILQRLNLKLENAWPF